MHLLPNVWPGDLVTRCDRWSSKPLCNTPHLLCSPLLSRNTPVCTFSSLRWIYDDLTENMLRFPYVFHRFILGAIHRGSEEETPLQDVSNPRWGHMGPRTHRYVSLHRTADTLSKIAFKNFL